ncbi:unnamed protein product [Owenia fusiformis]|uniref:Uncharacterized protein n=1 Tax=Owenia fusiformis TaxID=6347 RepID=A0A8J1U5N9_OWEFU|nr:unnamed protein product [Owenia fusiformis]
MKMSTSSSERECDIVKKGHMSIKRPPFQVKLGIKYVKTWQKCFWVLRDETIDTLRRLEVYNTETDYTNNKTPVYTLDLSSVIRLTEDSRSKSHPNALILVRCCHGPMYIACETQNELQSWKTALELVAFKTSTDSLPGCVKCNPQKSEKIRSSPTSPTSKAGLSKFFQKESPYAHLENGFAVESRPTAAAYLQDLVGNFTLHVQDSILSFKHPTSREIVKKWPLTCVRSITNMDEGNRSVITIQLELGGRKCPTKCTCRDGLLQFNTQHGVEICKLIKTTLPSIHCMMNQSPNVELNRRIRSKSVDKMNYISTKKNSNASLLSTDSITKPEMTRCQSYNNLVRNVVQSIVHKSKSNEKILQANKGNSGYLEPLQMTGGTSSEKLNQNPNGTPVATLDTPDTSGIRRKSGGFHFGHFPKSTHKRKSPPTPLPHPDYINSLLRHSHTSDSDTPSSESDIDGDVPPPLPPRTISMEHKYEYLEDEEEHKYTYIED